jgi:transposase
MSKTTTSSKVDYFRLPRPLWRKLKKHLPRKKRKSKLGGRPRVSDRAVANAIWYVLWTGCQWKALHRDWFGVSSSVVHERFQRWRRMGLFEKLAVVLAQAVERTDQEHDTLLECLASVPTAHEVDDRHSQEGFAEVVREGCRLRYQVARPGRTLRFVLYAACLITVMQFSEDLSDRQAADAVRGRIDWKSALYLELDNPGFDASVLCSGGQAGPW